MIAWLGWTWHTGHSDYPFMIVGIYATLAVFLILAARASGGRSGSREPPLE